MFRDIKYNLRDRFLNWRNRTVLKQEIWNLDSQLLAFILPRLKELRRIKPGYPADLTEQEWDEILDKMIYGFEQGLLCAEEYGLDEIPHSDETFKVGNYEFNRLDEEALKIWIGVQQERRKALEEALVLMGKYFFDLWC